MTSEQLKEVFANDERIVTTLDKDSFVTREDALLEIYRKLRPGDPPTVESSETLLDGLFFDRRRYDLFSVGRYKFNKKLGLAGRLIGHQLAAPVADPVTGELIAEPGEVFTRERAEYLDSCGVTDVTLRADGRDVRVFTNGMSTWPTSWTSTPPRSACTRRSGSSSCASSWSSTRATSSKRPSGTTSTSSSPST